jgi:hypothetical protein
VLFSLGTMTATCFADAAGVRAYMKTRKMEMGDPGDGPCSLFAQKEYEEKIERHGEVRGVAVNLMWIRLNSWAIMNQQVSPDEVDDCVAKDFKTSEALVKQEGGVEYVGFIVPRVTHVVVHDKNPFTKGDLRKISNDVVIYAFLKVFHRWIKETSTSLESTRKSILAICERTVLHWPCTFIYKEMKPEIEKDIFLYSVQLLETIKKDAEKHGSGGWQLVNLFAQAREIAKNLSGDVTAVGVQTMFANIDFAASSGIDLSDKGARQVQQMFLIYERATAAGIGHLLTKAKVCS